MNTLTNRQKEIFDFIKSKISDEGYPPTRMEISKFFGFKSPNAAEDHLKALKKKGFINILSGTSRGISLSDDDDNIPGPFPAWACGGSASPPKKTTRNLSQKWTPAKD